MVKMLLAKDPRRRSRVRRAAGAVSPALLPPAGAALAPGTPRLGLPAGRQCRASDWLLQGLLATRPLKSR